MIEFEDDFEIPVDKPTKPVMPQATANEQAFYTSEINEDEDLHEGIRHDLETTGTNPLHEFTQQNWMEEQDAMDNNILLDVISDPAIPLMDKKALVKKHNEVNFKSTNLRDQYIQKKASVTDSPINGGDMPVRSFDVEAQDLWIDTIEERKLAHDRVQQAKLEVAKNLDTSVGSVVGGILLDFLPLALPNVRAAAAAEAAGLSIDALEGGEGYANTLSNVATSFALTGSVSKKVADSFHDAPPEQQEQIFKDIVAALDMVPGTDFNKFIALQELIEAPLEDPAAVGTRDLLSLLEAHPLGQLITNPVRTIKWYTTFQRQGAATASGTGASTGATADDGFIPADQPEFNFKSRNVDVEDVGGVITPEGFRIQKADSDLPNYNLITPPKKALPAPTIETPKTDVPELTTDAKQIAEKFPTLSEEIQTKFSQAPTGHGRGNITDDAPGSPVRDAENTNAVDVAEDFVAGQNFGQQKAARELVNIAKQVPTAKDGKVFIDDLWKAAGGADSIPLAQFKEIIKDMHDKGSIKLVQSGGLSGTKKQAATLIGRNDEELDSISFASDIKKTVDDVLESKPKDKVEEVAEGQITGVPKASQLNSIERQIETNTFTVFRRDDNFPDANKPQGAFFNIEEPGFKTEFEDVGNKDWRFLVKPKNPLVLPPIDPFNTLDTAVLALEKVKGKEFLDNLKELGGIGETISTIRGTKKGLENIREVIKRDYPEIDSTKITDALEGLMTIGGVETRKAGFDAITALDQASRNLSELVVLDPALLKKNKVSLSKATKKDPVVDEFGDDLSSTKLMDDVLNKVFKSPEQKLEEATSKVYTQSFENKQKGNHLVRVPAALFDQEFAKAVDYVGANGVGGNKKKYDKFAKFFKETKNIEVGQVNVDKDGKVSFVDGKHRYAVLRDKGITGIPVSMDSKSVLNARANGLLEDIMESPAKPSTRGEITRISRATRPSVAPNSPAGTLAMSNPVSAANEAFKAFTEVSPAPGATATGGAGGGGGFAVGQAAVMSSRPSRMGASRAEYFGDWVLPKLEKALEEQFPDVAHMLAKFDKQAGQSFGEAGLDVTVTPITSRTAEADLLIDHLRNVQGSTYQQSNSTFHFGKDSARGLAQYGSNAQYGWSNLSDAERAFDSIQANYPNFPTRVIQKGNQYFVEQEWEHKFNALETFFFGPETIKASFLGVDVSGIARSGAGPWIIPSTMSDGSPQLARTGGAFLNELKANKIHTEFNVAVQKELLDAGAPRKELNLAFKDVQENQRWLTVGELKTKYAHLSKSKLEGLVKAYAVLKRLTDYHYNWVNRLDRAQAEAGNFKGLYSADGQMVGLGKTDFPESELPKIQKVWSFAKNREVTRPGNLEGQTLVRLRAPVKNNSGHVFNYALVDGGFEVGILPSRTLPRVEGWIARKNTEDFYIDALPRSATVDGRNINGATLEGEELLRNMKRTVGAGMTKAEAELLAQRLANEVEFQNDMLSVRKSSENVGNATITDYRQMADNVNNSRKRGERLPTLNGFSSVEDPVQSVASSMNTAVRLQVWQDYQDVYKQEFVKAWGKYTKGQYPTHISQIEAKKAMSATELVELKTAQRSYEYLNRLQQFSTRGDEVWANFFQGIADAIEPALPAVSTFARATARQGNVPIRGAKSLATVLFIHTNPARQWMVQPQQLMELNLIMPEYARQSALDIPAIITAMYSKAPHTGELELPLYNMAKKMAGMPDEEFDEVFEALYNTGLPQAVDMNSMLLGMLHETKINLDPTLAEDIANKFGKVVRSPGMLGKNIGFTPAEMANNVGSWLFSRQRWMKDNPGKNWNTPENLATITKNAWDISHSMIGKAGALPYQSGMLGTVLQFQAVQHKGFTQVLMSKTLTPLEKTKLTAARLALYGARGVPLGVVVGDVIVNEFGDDETKATWNEGKNGLIDKAVNTLADIYLVTSGQFEGKASDIRLSQSLTPIPETAPFWELIVETGRILEGEGGGNPRLPFMQALGTLAESSYDFIDHFRVQDMDTVEALQAFGLEFAQLSSGYNNWAKAKMISNFDDKVNKKGQRLGLELTRAHMVAQLFGAVSQQELSQYEFKDAARDRDETIAKASRDIYDSMVKLQDKIGTDDWRENQRRVNVLVTALVGEGPEGEAIRNEIIEGVYNLDRGTLKRGTVQDTIIHKIYSNKSGLRDEMSKKMVDKLREQAKSNDSARKTLELLEAEGVI